MSHRIGDDGAWHSRFYRNLQLSGEWTSEYPPFITALGMLSLQTLHENPAAQKLRARSREFLLARAESPGVWRYSDRLPPDLDDTALCTLAVGAHPWALFSDRHIQIALTCRNSHGRFRSWILPRRLYRQSLPAAHHTDSVVNANALAWLGVRAQTEAAARWLTELVESGDEKNSSYYYPEVVDLHIAMARAAAINAPLFADLRATLIARLREWLARESDDIARVAQTLSALHMLGVNFGGDAEFDATIRRVLDAQRDDGSWDKNLLWRGPVPPAPPSLGYASEALSTAFCVEALARASASPPKQTPLPTRKKVTPKPKSSSQNKYHSLADLLRPLRKIFAPALLADDGWNRLISCAETLPFSVSENTFGFEFRLAEPQPNADLCVMANPRSNFAKHCITAGIHAGFFRAQTDSETFFHREVANAILEYDISETLNDAHINMSQPGIFLVPKIPVGESYPRHTDPTALTAALIEVAGWHDDADELRMMKRIFDLLAKIKSSAHISQAGVLPSRTPRALRVVIKNLSAENIPDFLARLKWCGSLQLVEKTLRDINDSVEQFAVSLDITAGEITPRIGLELYQPSDWYKCRGEEWQPLLANLAQKNFCLRDKADALLDWCGVKTVTHGAQTLHTCGGINHIKLVADAQKIYAKGYAAMIARVE